jgi:hypothetical protein
MACLISRDTPRRRRAAQPIQIGDDTREGRASRHAVIRFCAEAGLIENDADAAVSAELLGADETLAGPPAGQCVCCVFTGKAGAWAGGDAVAWRADADADAWRAGADADAWRAETAPTAEWLCVALAGGVGVAVAFDPTARGRRRGVVFRVTPREAPRSDAALPV